MPKVQSSTSVQQPKAPKTHFGDFEYKLGNAKTPEDRRRLITAYLDAVMKDSSRNKTDAFIDAAKLQKTFSKDKPDGKKYPEIAQQAQHWVMKQKGKLSLDPKASYSSKASQGIYTDLEYKLGNAKTSEDRRKLVDSHLDAALVRGKADATVDAQKLMTRFRDMPEVGEQAESWALRNASKLQQKSGPAKSFPDSKVVEKPVKSLQDLGQKGGQPAVSDAPKFKVVPTGMGLVPVK